MELGLVLSNGSYGEMVTLTKKKLKVIVDIDTPIKSQVRHYLQKKLRVENPDYPFIERQYYNLLRSVKKVSEQLAAETEHSSRKKLSFQLKALQRKTENFKKYLDHSSDFISFYRTDKTTDLDSFGIGLLNHVRKLLRRKRIAYKIIDPSKNSYPDINADQEFNRKYQKTAVEKILKKKFGIVKLPTGSGKTMISYKLIQAILPYLPTDSKILFVVEQKDLILQTRDEYIDQDPSLANKISIVGGGNLDLTGDIVIGTVQTLSSFKKRQPKDFSDFHNSVYMYIVDECDMFTSDARLKFLKKFDSALYRVFLSATPHSRFKQVRKWKLRELSGGIICTIKEEDLIKKKFLAKQEAIFIKNYNNQTHNVKNVYWRDRWKVTYEEMVVNSQHRNNLCRQIYAICRLYGLRTLFVVERKEHAEILGRILAVPVYTGSNDIYERAQAIKEMRTGKEKVIVTTRIFRRAINIPELQVFVNVAGYKNDNMVTQSKGRIGRITKDKREALYIDFFDFGNDYLEGHSAERLKTIETLNIKPKTMYINELEDFIKKYFNKQNGEK